MIHIIHDTHALHPEFRNFFVAALAKAYTIRLQKCGGEYERILLLWSSHKSFPDIQFIHENQYRSRISVVVTDDPARKNAEHYAKWYIENNSETRRVYVIYLRPRGMGSTVWECCVDQARSQNSEQDAIWGITEMDFGAAHESAFLVPLSDFDIEEQQPEFSISADLNDAYTTAERIVAIWHKNETRCSRKRRKIQPKSGTISELKIERILIPENFHAIAEEEPSVFPADSGQKKETEAKQLLLPTGTDTKEDEAKVKKRVSSFCDRVQGLGGSEEETSKVSDKKTPEVSFVARLVTNWDKWKKRIPSDKKDTKAKMEHTRDTHFSKVLIYAVADIIIMQKYPPEVRKNNRQYNRFRDSVHRKLLDLSGGKSLDSIRTARRQAIETIQSLLDWSNEVGPIAFAILLVNLGHTNIAELRNLTAKLDQKSYPVEYERLNPIYLLFTLFKNFPSIEREHILKRFGHPLPYEVVELYTVSQGEPGKLEGLHRAAKSALQPKRGDPFIEGRRPFEACETYLAAVTELLKLKFANNERLCHVHADDFKFEDGIEKYPVMLHLVTYAGHVPDLKRPKRLCLVLPYFEGSKPLYICGTKIEWRANSAIVFRGSALNAGEEAIYANLLG